MNAKSWLLWGFVATAVLTMMLSGSQGLKLTRINLPFILGTAFTPDRDRARIVGFFVHMANGWLLALVYVALFAATGGPTWWKGAFFGLGHALFVLAALMPLLPGLHPRMASEQHGPTARRQIEPPGFMAVHYGVRTPVSVLLAHVVYGAILGAFYQPA